MLEKCLIRPRPGSASSIQSGKRLPQRRLPADRKLFTGLTLAPVRGLYSLNACNSAQDEKAC
jgi:hypothetical protein